MLISKDKIQEFLPQHPPILMVDNLIEYHEKGAVTDFYIQPTCLFVENGYLQEPGLVENIAQTGAARVGYICKTKNVEVPLGFIGSIKDLIIHKLPKVQTTITTEILITNEIFDVTIIYGKVVQDEEILAECEMKIFVKFQNS